MKLVKLLFVSTFMLFASMTYAGPRADWLAVADAVALIGNEAAAEDIRAAVDAMTDEELYLGHGQLDLVGVAEAFMDTAEAFRALEAMSSVVRDYAKSNKSFDADLERSPGKQVIMSAGLPGASGYPTSPFPCPFSPDRSSADALLVAVDLITAAGLVRDAAQGVWNVSDRACGTVVVAIGAAGNPQNAVCIAADLLLLAADLAFTAAEGVTNHLAFCDAAVDSAEIEGAYDRAGHIHTDLADHDTEIKAQLATHDADIKLLLGDIQDTVDENQRLIKIFMSRQLESMRLLITPSGRREIDAEVLTCTGDNCPVIPAFEMCANGSLKWNCR